MKYMQGWSLRSVLFGIGAIGAVATATDMALKQGLSLTQLVSVVCTALAAYTMKYHGDLTASEADEQAERAVRRSIMPPPQDEP